MRVYSILHTEHNPRLIEIELHSRFQIPCFNILGLPGPEIQEARERIIAAFDAVGFEFPKKKVVVNLTPSNERKTGTGHDLGIALKIVKETLDIPWPENIYAWGELGLNGSIKKTGFMQRWLEYFLNSTESKQVRLLFCSSDDQADYQRLIAWRKSQGLHCPKYLEVIGLKELSQVALGLETWVRHAAENPSSELIMPASPIMITTESKLMPLDADFEKLLMLSLIGEHHLLLLGPKGVGKSHSLNWLQALSPTANPEQSWKRILVVDEMQANTTQRPVIRVHSNLKPAHLLGSFTAKGFRAGELSKAHGGYLIADEFPEWPRDAKECLREPLENKRYRLTRRDGTVELDCDVQFIGTGNLCPCGGFPAELQARLGKSTSKRCRCRPNEVAHYLNRVSGPLLDRIDLVFLHSGKKVESSGRSLSELRVKQDQARAFLIGRYGVLSGKMSPLLLEENLKAHPKKAVLSKILDRSCSLRSRHKVLRVAYSLQAYHQATDLLEEHLCEAMMYRFDGLQ